LNLFGPEVTGDGREAHQEGLSTQFRYSAFGLGRDRLWMAALGFKVKWKDANRKIMLDIPPEKTEMNDNLQTVYCEIAKNLTSTFWFIHWSFINRVETQWRPSDGAIYLENTFDIRGFRKIWTHYGLETRLKGLAGEFNGGTYYGVGVTCVFTFRHLGIASNRMDISPTP
jgi:hypothetical protein